MKILKLENVSKYYKSAETVSVGMKNVSASFDIGEFVAITGESGSGKSTLLNVISGLDGYEEGELYHYGEETSHYTISDWETYRSSYVGFVFQNYNIIDSYTVYQNVLFALEVQGYPKDKRRKRALELIDRVGLSSHKNHKASKLSGGQKQRAVLARALAKDTPIIVADEPTGNLDSESSKQVMALLHEISKDKLVIVVTHDYAQVEPYATRKIRMHDGTIVEDVELKEFEKQEQPVKLEAKKVSWLTLFKISLRNIFSTPKRTIFMLILQILVIGIFTLIFSSQVKARRELGLMDSETYPQVPETRLLVERRDGEPLSSAEIDKIKSNRNVLTVYENAHLFHNNRNLRINLLNSHHNFYVSKTDSAKILSKGDVKGELPKEINEVVVSSYYNTIKVGDVIGLAFTPIYYYGGNLEHFVEFKVVGLDKLERRTIYFSEAYLTQEIVADIDVNLYNHVRQNLKDSLYCNLEDSVGFELEYDPNATLLYDIQMIKSDESQTYVVENNVNVKFHTYYEHTSTVILEVGSVGKVEGEFYGGLIKKELLDQVLDLSMQNYGSKYKIDKNMISVEVANFRKGDNFIKSIDQTIYKVYYPANISSPLQKFMLFIQGLISGLLLVGMGFFLYAIVHAVSKNIMASRKKDFAIFRSIGTNKSALAKMVVLEQVIMNMIGFVITMIGFYFLQYRFSNIRTLLDYMKFSDYIVLVLIFLFLGVWLGLRFNKKVFNQSVIQVLTLSKEEF